LFYFIGGPAKTPLLGFQFSPRLSNVGATRLWRIDRTADYGVLNDLSCHPIRTQLIVEHWDDLLRLAGSLSTGTVQTESLIRTLQRGDRPTKLGRALQELGRVIKTLFVLNYLDDEAYRRRMLTQLNRAKAGTSWRGLSSMGSAANCASATVRGRRTS